MVSGMRSRLPGAGAGEAAAAFCARALPAIAATTISRTAATARRMLRSAEVGGGVEPINQFLISRRRFGIAPEFRSEQPRVTQAALWTGAPCNEFESGEIIVWVRVHE